MVVIVSGACDPDYRLRIQSVGRKPAGYALSSAQAVNGKPANFTADELNTLSLALSELGDIMKDTSRSIARP